MTISQKEWDLRTQLQKKRNEEILIHLTDVTHSILPCPDDYSVRHDYTELASKFRSKRGRWPLWWEMAKAIQEFEEES